MSPHDPPAPGSATDQDTPLGELDVFAEHWREQDIAAKPIHFLDQRTVR
ncbi:hypothetical protein ACIBF6_09985 [Streptosporangium amethystogenes]